MVHALALLVMRHRKTMDDIADRYKDDVIAELEQFVTQGRMTQKELDEILGKKTKKSKVE